MGSYMPRFLTRKLPYGFHGFEVACLNVEENTWMYSDNLIKIVFFDENACQVPDLATITIPEPELPPEEVSPVKIDR